MEKQALVTIFRALGDVNRISILLQLQEGEKCASELLQDLPIGQSTLSHHMGVLCESGLVNVRKSGRNRRYVLNAETIRSFLSNLSSASAERDALTPAAAHD